MKSVLNAEPATGAGEDMTHQPQAPKILPGTIAMMAATMLSNLDEEDFTDIYDRGAYIVNNISLRQLALRRVASAAVELARCVEEELARVSAHSEKPEPSKPAQTR